MIKLVKRMSLWSVFAAVVFMIVQIIADLYLPTLTSNIINDGVAKGDINYIWSTGVVMLGFSLISIVASIGNTFFATKESQSLGKKLRTDIYRKVENFSNNEFDKFGTASL
ncbi:ABC transporter transmembrane domain-containing protein, partial [Enterococcus faecalis]